MTTTPEPRCFRFSVRDLLWLTLVVALMLGWAADHFHTAIEPRKVFRSAGQTPNGTEIAVPADD
jgi:hypothetical protein